MWRGPPHCLSVSWVGLAPFPQVGLFPCFCQPPLSVWLAHSIIHVSAEILSLMGPFSVYMNMGPYVGEVALPPSSLIILLSTELT